MEEPSVSGRTAGRPGSRRRSKDGPGGPSVRLLDDTRTERKGFDVGESVFLAADGLRPATVHEVVLRDGEWRPSALAALMTDRHGSIPPTVVLPYLGLTAEGEESSPGRSHAEGEQALGGRTLAVGVRYRGRVAAEARLSVSKRGRRPQVVPCDMTGRLRPGILAGAAEVAVALRNFPRGCVRLFLVPRQFDWRPGDPIRPVVDESGAPVTAMVEVGEDGSGVIPLWPRERTHPGSYQIVARIYRPGWWDADDMVLLADDVLSSRRFSSVVVRSPIDLTGFADGGGVMTPQIAGRPVAGSPYFQFVNNFPKGSDVYAALDPAALPPGLVSQRAAIYVISHKSVADWSLSTALTDVSGPGMTPAVEVVPIVPGCINWNETLVWPNPQTPGQYDIVVDFGNNVAVPSQFVTDANFDQNLDMIDGYVRVGLYITEDPSLPGPFAGAIGQHSYNNGLVQVPSTDTGLTPTETLQLQAVVRYPAQSSGVDAPFQPGSFPLVVIVHGNSTMQTSYLGYNYLLDHLAGHGFIAMSVYAPPYTMIETRARALFEHLNIMTQKNSSSGLFQGHVDFANVGIMGHSRGGEAVIRAAKINTAETLGWNLRCGVAIAPTDFRHYGDPGLPLLVIYGSNDGDVAGWWAQPPSASFTGFDIYDEAGRPRSFVFVYGATHDRFNSEWASSENSAELSFPPGSTTTEWNSITTSDLPKLIPESAHQNVAKGYATAYFQMQLQGRPEQVEYFLGNLKPSLVDAVQIHTSHQAPGTLVIDDYEQLPHDASTNSLGGAVTATALASPPAENWLHTIDTFSPHMTSGGNIAWNSSMGVYLTAVPAANKDLSAFTALSFRVTQRYGSAQNPANQTQELYVRLMDGGGNTRAIRTGAFSSIPYPYDRGVTQLIKSAMKTVRIPLASYTVANAGAQIIDLTNVQSIAFGFLSRPIGEIEVDDIELVP